MFALLAPALKWLMNPKALLGLAIVAAVGTAYFVVKHQGYQQATAELQPKITLLEGERDAANKRAAAADLTYRQTEKAWQSKLKESEDAYQAQRAKNDQKLAAAVASNAAAVANANASRLRDQLSAYAAGPAPAPNDTCAPERARASALGLLLADVFSFADEAMQAGAEATGAAESTGDSVRALKASWPMP